MHTDRCRSTLAPDTLPSLLSSLTGTALLGWGSLLGWHKQLLSAMCLQQHAKANALEVWLNNHSEALQNSLEEGMHASKDLYVATGNAQADWLQASERLLAEANRNLMLTFEHLSPCSGLPAAALQQVCSAMKVSSCAVESMTKATRQVTHFASTNLGNAAVNAVRAAREEMTSHHNPVTRHH